MLEKPLSVCRPFWCVSITFISTTPYRYTNEKNGSKLYLKMEAWGRFCCFEAVPDTSHVWLVLSIFDLVFRITELAGYRLKQRYPFSARFPS